MNTLKPITTEYIRRFSILILLALFAWMFFYSPPDIYEIQVKNYTQRYHDEVKNASLDPSETLLDQYIAYKMKGAYTWSKRKQKIVELKGKHKEFLNHIFNVNSGNTFDKNISQHRSSDTFWSANSYFFTSNELPNNFLSQTFLKHPNYLMVKDKDGNKRYFSLYKTQRSSAIEDAPISVSHPLRMYSYLLLVLSILIYIYLPRPKVPDGAAYYTRFNAVYLADVLGIFLWMGAWMFFFLPDDSAPMVVRYIFLLFFVIFALAIVLPTIKYASNWYLFTDKMFKWSDEDGVGSIYTKDIISIEPYKKQISKWVAVMIVLFGRGKVGATGMGSLAASSTPEIGMEITIKSGKKIKVMANYLEANEVFTKRFQELKEKLEDKK
jgi:hypothetical protein